MISMLYAPLLPTRNTKNEIHEIWSEKDKSIKYLEWHSKFDATNNERMKWHKLHDLGMHIHRIPAVCLCIFLVFRARSLSMCLLFHTYHLQISLVKHVDAGVGSVAWMFSEKLGVLLL